MLIFMSIIPTLGLFGPLGLATSFLILAIYPTFLFIQQGKLKSLWDSNLNKLIIVFFAYALISALWAIKPNETVNLWVRMVLFFIGGLAMFAYVEKVENKEKLLKALLFGIVLAIFIANIELFTNGFLTRTIRFYTDVYLAKNHEIRPFKDDYVVEMNRGASILTVISWAAICYLYGKGQVKTAILLYIAVISTVMRMESFSTVVGLFVSGVFVLPIVYFKGKKALKVFAVLAAIGVAVVATGGALLNAHKLVGNVPVIPGAASDIRLYIWDYASKQALKKPVFGWGFNASRSYPVEKSDYVQNGRSPLPLHPHNNTLQVWLELGVVGLVMFAGFLALLLVRISNMQYSQYVVAAFSGLFANYFIIGQTGYGVWQNWWVASGLLAAAFLLLCAKMDIEKR